MLHLQSRPMAGRRASGDAGAFIQQNQKQIELSSGSRRYQPMRLSMRYQRHLNMTKMRPPARRNQGSAHQHNGAAESISGINLHTGKLTPLQRLRYIGDLCLWQTDCELKKGHRADRRYMATMLKTAATCAGMAAQYIRPKLAPMQFKPEQRHSLNLALLNDDDLAALERILSKAQVLEVVKDPKAPDEYLDLIGG
jgi:hypothetical protein